MDGCHGEKNVSDAPFVALLYDLTHMWMMHFKNMIYHDIYFSCRLEVSTQFNIRVHQGTLVANKQIVARSVLFDDCPSQVLWEKHQASHGVAAGCISPFTSVYKL